MTTEPGIEAVIFDAEGVIVDTEHAWDEGQRIFLARRGIEYERDRVKAMLTGRSLEDGTRVLKDLFGLDGEPADLARERVEIVRERMSEVGFVPGFVSFFERLGNRYRTCVATAMTEELFDVVDASLHVRELFDGRVYTLADVGSRSKPDPALFLFAASRIEVPPSSCLVIEDSPYGIDAARHAGMRVVGLTTTYGRETLSHADAVVASFDELDLDRLPWG